MRQVRRLPIWRGSMASLKRRCTIGRRSSAGWTSPRPSGCGNSRTRTPEEAAGRADAGYCGATRAFVKKMVGPVAKREAVAHLQAVMGLSERRACDIVGADRKM